MTLSLSKLMARSALAQKGHLGPYIPVYCKSLDRLLAIADAALSLNGLCERVDFRDTAQLNLRASPHFEALRASLEGVEL